MASKITAATLTVKISELIELDGKNRGSDNIQTISSINEVDNRIMTALSASEQSLFKLSGTVSAGTFVTSSLKYARVTNKDDTYPVRLRVSSSILKTGHCDFSIDPGGSFILTNSKISGSVTGNSNTYSFNDITDVLVQSSGSDVDVEYFIAST